MIVFRWWERHTRETDPLVIAGTVETYNSIECRRKGLGAVPQCMEAFNGGLDCCWSSPRDVELFLCLVTLRFVVEKRLGLLAHAATPNTQASAGRPSVGALSACLMIRMRVDGYFDLIHVTLYEHLLDSPISPFHAYWPNADANIMS